MVGMQIDTATTVVQMVKHLLAMQKTWVQSLDQEDPLEKEMATHFSMLAWEIPWTKEPGGLLSMGLQKSRTKLGNSTTTTTSFFSPNPYFDFCAFKYDLHANHTSID